MNFPLTALALFMVSFIRSTGVNHPTDVVSSADVKKPAYLLSQYRNLTREILTTACSYATIPFATIKDECTPIIEEMRLVIHQLFDGLIEEKEEFVKKLTSARSRCSDLRTTRITENEALLTCIFSLLPGITENKVYMESKNKFYKEFNRKYNTCMDYVDSLIRACDSILGIMRALGGEEYVGQISDIKNQNSNLYKDMVIFDKSLSRDLYELTRMCDGVMENQHRDIIEMADYETGQWVLVPFN